MSQTVISSLLGLSIVFMQLSMYLNNKTIKCEIDTLKNRISFLEMRFDLNKKFAK